MANKRKQAKKYYTPSKKQRGKSLVEARNKPGNVNIIAPDSPVPANNAFIDPVDDNIIIGGENITIS